MTNMENPRQTTPTGESPNSAVGSTQDNPATDATATETPLDLHLPPAELAPLARAWRRETLADAQRAYRDDFLAVAADSEDAPLPWAMEHPETLTAEAMEQVSRAVAFGERTGHYAASASALALFNKAFQAGRAAGIAELATTQYADHLKWREEMDRALVDSLTKGTPYAQLCEIRGEHDRAERARRLYAERGIA